MTRMKRNKKTRKDTKRNTTPKPTSVMHLRVAINYIQTTECVVTFDEMW